MFTYLQVFSCLTHAGLLYVGLHFGSLFNFENQKNKYYYSSVNEDLKGEYLNKLQTLMDQKKLYLNPDLTLDITAKHLGIKPRILSQVINEKLNITFKEYLNNLRLTESLQRLSDIKYKSHTVLEILYDSGFNSKSSFYNLFERKTGKTPTDYRKEFLPE